MSGTSARPISEREFLAMAGGFLDRNYEQSLTYERAAAARIGAGTQIFAIEAGADVLALALVRVKAVPGLGRGIAWVPSGPLVVRQGLAPPDAAHLAAVLGALRQRVAVEEGHILRVRLAGQSLVDPAVEEEAFCLAGFHPSRWDHAYHSALMDLAKDDAALMAALDHKWRTNLRHGLRAELAIDAGDTADLRARFLTLYDDARRLKGFDVDIPPEFYFELAGPDLRLDVLIVHQDGVDLAGGVSGFTGPAGIYLFAATPEAGRQFRAGYLLTWQVITRSRELGASTFDIGGIDVTGRNEEVARFKQRLHGTPIDNQVYETDGGGSAVPMIRALEGLHHRMHHRAHP